MGEIKEQWSKGKDAGTIVSNVSHYKHEMPDKVEYYGGHLIAESIPARYVSLIIRSPSMLALLEKALPIIQVEANVRDNALSHKGANDQNIYWSEMRELANEISTEIDRARGKGE